MKDLTKDEILKRYNFICVHHHRGTEHPKCYEQAKGLEDNIGFLDIETSNLSSDFGVVLSYCIGSEGKYKKRVLSQKEIRKGIYDRRLLEECCRDIKDFSRVVTYYGSKFDIPFLRSRCLYWSLDFPVFKEVLHTDAYLVVKYKFGTLHSRRLGVVAPFFGIEAKTHPLSPQIWFKCMSGDEKALQFVLTHNIEDVISLEKLWKKISKYTKLNKTSI